MHIRLPTWATLALSLLAGVIAYLNQEVFSVPEPWHTLLTVGLTVLAALGIAPAVHGALRTALHLPYPAAISVSAALGTGAVALATIHINSILRSLLVGALTTLAGALVGPEASVVPVPVPAQRGAQGPSPLVGGSLTTSPPATTARPPSPEKPPPPPSPAP